MSKPLRVLIVEDSEDDTDLIVYQLERGGYAPIYQRVDSPAAMTAALEQQQWDVVLADHSLPRFSGRAALTLLQEKGLDLPFIIVSGSIGDEVAVAAMKAGAHDYLMKGNLSRLVPAVDRELQEAASRRDRQQIQSELRDSEDRWQLALSGSNDGIWDWNIKTNEVFFSPRWKEMLGYAEDEIVNHFDTWSKLVHPDDLGMVTLALQDHLAGKTEFYRTECRMQCKDECYKWILSRGQALWDEAGNPTRMVGSHTDITPTKQMEAALRQQAENLAQVNRLKDEFLAVVSHELRTPLNAILGWSNLLQNRKIDKDTTVRALETIERSAKLQKQLVEDLLDVSRIIQGKIDLRVSPVNLIPIIESAVATVRIAAEAKAIQLKLRLDPVGLVNGDANRLQQVFWNLLANAIKFTPASGLVEVQLSMVSGNMVDGKGNVGESSPPSTYAQVQVIDTGIGIKAEFLPYVFDRFRQENSSITRIYGGLGLGLALVRHLVELHGGTVNVDSPGEGKGTTFTVKIPQLPESSKAEDLSTSKEITPHLSLNGLQILVVDDDADSREFLDFALTSYGAEVLAAACASEAIAAFKQFNPDVLVSDLGMPGEDGYTLIRMVRMLESKQGRNIPAIALTGYARDSDRDKALAAGFGLHMSKPIDTEELVAAIAKLSSGNALISEGKG